MMYSNRNAVTSEINRKSASAAMAVCMSAALVAGGLAPAGAAFADESPDAPTKSQVVYVKTATDGATSGVYVVNRFDNAQGASIEDAGTYESTVNLSSGEKLSSVDPSFESDSESFSYQGNLSADTEMPWTVGTTYYLNGEKMSAEEIAGKSGHVRIEASIAPNDTCGGPYAENYLVQATASLDDQMAENVASDTGTIAQAVGAVQTSFMVLPGKSAVCAVEADVDGFEFDGWQIVGVPLSMAIDVDDSKFASATGSLKDLESATRELADGAGQVEDGAATVGDALDALAGSNAALAEGASAYAGAVGALSVAAQQLDTVVSASLVPGMRQLAAGSASYQEGLTAQAASLAAQAAAVDVDGAQAGCQSAATAASEAFAQAYATAFSQAYASAFAQAYATALADGADSQTALRQASAKAAQVAAGQAASTAASSSEVTTAQARTAQATQALAQAAAEKAGAKAASEALAGAASSYDALAQGIAAIADEDSSTGIAALAQATSQLSTGLSQALSAYGQLQQGIGQYTQGVGELAGRYGTFQSGVSSLSSGASELATQTSGIDQKALDQVKDQLSEYLNPEFQQQDFVNGETDGISAVQFIYKTGEVKAQAGASEAVDNAVESAEEESGQTFLEKLAALFGL